MTTGSTVDSVTSYLPALVLRRIEADPTPIRAARADSVPSALLFADISGFTALTERLARSGPEGAEVLTRCLNDYFTRLVELVSAHGGDVVKFAGDAVIALWTAERRDDVPAATLRACQCALAVQAALRGYVSPTGDALSLKVALGAGRLFAIHLGGELERWELVLNGPPLRDVGLAGKQCAPGAVVVSRSAWELVAERAVGEPLEEGVVRLGAVARPLPIVPLRVPVLGPEAGAALWAYVPGAIRARLRSGQDLWLAELRRITVLFATLPGHDGALTLEQSQALVSGLQSVLYRYEGSVNKLSVDDKGVSLVAVLGMPPLAHEDDPARGLLVALGMRAVFERHGWQSAIGVATGRAFCGVVGSPRRCEYTLIGDVVNLAARLMVAARGTILCDAETRRAAAGRVDFDELEPLALKGKSAPVPVFHPRAPARRRARLFTSEIVGRARERELLASRIEALARSESSTVVLEGEAGIGKSRLLDEAHRLAAQQVALLCGAADAIERATPYLSWRAVFAELLGLGEVADVAERRARVLERLCGDPARLRLAPLLGAVVSIDLADNDHTQPMSAEVRADNTHALLIGLLRDAAAKAPLAITLEDAHWMDSASWALVRLATREVAPLLLVLTTRPVDVRPADMTRLLGAPTTVHLVLDSLDPEQAAELVRQRLDVDALPDVVARLIAEKAHGNPFFTEELAYALRDAGLIEVADGRCRVRPGVDLLASTDIPDTVQGVVTQRIDRLDPTQQLALKVASVIGRVFALDTLRDVFPLTGARQQLAAHLEALHGLDITGLEQPEPELAYIFKHVITQEVTYNLMLFEQRRELHRAVAVWYERVHAPDLAPYYSLLAHHWSRAEDGAKAVDYLERAGDQARGNYANAEAVDCFSEALRVDARRPEPSAPERRAHWEHQLGEARFALGDPERAVEHLQRATALLGHPFASRTWDVYARLAWGVVVQTWHRLFPARTLGRRADERERLLLCVRAYERLTQIHYIDNDKYPTVCGGLRGLNLSEAAGVSPELARTYSHMAVVAAVGRLGPLAELYDARAHATAEALNDPYLFAYMYEVTGMYRVGLGHWKQAHANLDRAIAIATDVGEQRRWDESMAISLMACWRRSDIERCITEARAVWASGERQGIAQVSSWGLGGLVGALMTRGLGRAETDALEQLLATAELPDTDAIYAHGCLAAARWRQGLPAQALAAAVRVAELTSISRIISHYLLEGFSGAAHVHLALWEHDGHNDAEHVGRTRLLCKAARAFGAIYPIGRPEALLHTGTLRWLEGRPEHARRLWQQSVESAGELAMPYVAALAHARLAGGSPTDRHAHAAAARAGFTALDATDDLARLEFEERAR